jgi:hypothetical protein
VCLVKLCALRPSCCADAWDDQCIEMSRVLCESTCKPVL